jgi:tetratricopeptide (TPR) repeat protein
VQPSLFDMFYEEFISQFMSAGDPTIMSQQFIKLRTDIERIEFLMKIQFVKDFEIKNKAGVKNLEKATRYREEGNKMFQVDKCMEAILFYNKSISYCPHPTADQLQAIKQSQLSPETEGVVKLAGSYEALSLSYANRSAALKKLNQYDECLRDIARAAQFGYPKENFFKLWERKGRCYQGLKRADLAAKCLRQALHCLKESSLSDTQKCVKASDIQQALKELRSNLLSNVDADNSQTINNEMNISNKTSSQLSISNISTSAVKYLVEVPEISYGVNPRLQSASMAIDLQFIPEKGRFFVANQDLKPGEKHYHY